MPNLFAPCALCRGEYTQSPVNPALYCPGCVELFKGFFEKSSKRSHSSIGAIAFFAESAAKTLPGGKAIHYPRSYLDTRTGVYYCGLCGAVAQRIDYGQCAFGCGAYRLCGCGALLDFEPDTGE